MDSDDLFHLIASSLFLGFWIGVAATLWGVGVARHISDKDQPLTRELE